MHSLASYFIGGLAVLLAADYLTPPSRTMLDTRASAPANTVAGSIAPAPPTTIVDRTNKGDRLIVNNNAVRSPRSTPARVPKVMVGCDPAFSPLAVSARLNYPSRCLASNETGRKSIAAL